ncbi:hypothetical protein LSTR_LSTR004124 [Laodelphax striatellus]|uniref:Uncharacterized protein n=1 Tax=Laodelphax striatellus TaxID=195883 RepID=A0A482WHJ0_LAOST|nr:hypothetical protein LSTR_LSTR004124 [Laodelphax striatellus]
MIHRTSSSRKRRGSRSAATSPHRGSSGGARRPSMMVVGGDAAPLGVPALGGMPRGRRASIAVSSSDLAARGITVTAADDDEVVAPDTGYPDSDPEHDDNSLMPELAVYNRSPRGSLVPQESNRSPRNSLTPDAAGYNRSPRNSLVPDTSYSRSPRNSLVPDVPAGGGGGGNRSARNSLVPTEYSRSPRGSLLPDVENFSRTSRTNLLPEPPDSYSRSPRNSLVPEYNSRSARNSLVPDISPSRSQRNSLVPDQPINKSPRGSLVPETGATRSPRGSLVPEPTPNRSPRGSLVPEPGNNIVPRSSPRGSITSEVSFNKSPRNSLPLQDSASIRSPRGSITSAAGALIDTTRSPRGSVDIVAPGSSRGGGVNRSPSPYRKSTRSANVNNAVEGGSRRASSSVSQASADDRRQLCGEHTKLNSEAGLGLSAYGSVVYQLNHANMESSGLCDFVCRALHIVYRTGVVFIVLGCLFTLPVAMFIIGIQYAKDCPKEPILPVYMIVGGGFGTIKMLWMLWNQYRSMTYERLDARSRSSGSSGDDPISTGGKITNFLLSSFLIVWFVMGNVWIWGMGWPDFKPTLLDPNSWCDKTLFLFALTHLVVLYSLIGVVVIVIIVLIASQVCVCPMLIHCK